MDTKYSGIDTKDCTKCEDYLSCNYNQIGIGAGCWAIECKDYKEVVRW